MDGGLPDTAPLIIANFAALGLDIADARLIVNSRPHYDLAGGIAAPQHASGASCPPYRSSASAAATGSATVVQSSARSGAIPFPRMPPCGSPACAVMVGYPRYQRFSSGWIATM